MYGYIYKTTNISNNKIYVGQKKSDVFLAEYYLGSGRRLRSAIQHYGKDVFKVELIDTADSKAELDEKEIYWISELKAQNNKIGYNIASGGEGGDTFSKHSTEEKLKIVEKIKISHTYVIGRRYVTKDGKNKIVKPEDLENYLEAGWKLGRHADYVRKTGYKQSKEWVEKRMKTITNRSSEKILETSRKHSEATKKQMNSYTPEKRSSIAKNARNAKSIKLNGACQRWMHKDGINKFVYEPELEYYRSIGYELGRVDSDETKLKRSSSGKQANHRSGFTYVYKDETCICIDAIELSKYESDGWKRGNLNLRGVKKCKKV